MANNITKKLREAVKTANEKHQRNLYFCILLNEAANEIERLQKQVVIVDAKKPSPTMEVRP